MSSSVSHKMAPDRSVKVQPGSPVGVNANGSTETSLSRIYYDHVSVLVHCTTDNTFFLAFAQPSGALTLLGTQPVQFGHSWKKMIESFFQNAGLPQIKPAGIVHLDRWCVPGADKMVSHAVYSASVEADVKKVFSEKFPGAWLTIAEIENAQHTWRLISPSINDIVLNMDEENGSKAMNGQELTYDTLFVGLQQSPGKKMNGFEHLVTAALFGKQEQELLYKEFLAYTCPYTTMGWVPFVTFMKELGWQESALQHLFRAFDIRNQIGLTFREFMYGMAAVEPNVQHGGPPAETRCRYIFRYYDRNGDSTLSVDEFTAIVMDVQRAKGIPIDMRHVQAETERIFKVFGGTISHTIPLNNFLTSVGQLKFRGTSYLLRSPTSLPVYLKTRQAGGQGVLLHPMNSRLDIDSIGSSLSDEISAAGTQIPGKTSKYALAAHSVRIRKSGTLLDVHSMDNAQNIAFMNRAQPSAAPTSEDQTTKRILSYDHFNQEAQPNEMLNGLKYFEKAIPINPNRVRGKPPYNWGEVDHSSLAKCLLTLCQKAREIMQSEPRLLEIAAPCYIMGDLHGNFPDLLCFEKALWKLGPMLTPASFLFLGDFVDRGAFGVEVVAYLFAHKILSPTKFYLLRGNHEIREVQQMFTFFRECIEKFGDRIGREIWEEINATFDCMPLAAVVDKKIFCAHGGICPPWFGDGLVSIINTIPCPLPKPEETSPLAWELMWNDPDRAEDAQSSPSNPDSSGFKHNMRRGTGHTFSEDALDSFLNRNGFSHVVRAHEVQQCGFQVQHGGKLLTVFSSSRYCGGSNEAACILADKQKLRSIRIDTT